MSNGTNNSHGFKNDLLYPTLTLVIICFIVTLLLSGTNLLTSKRIEKLSKKQQNDSMSEVMPADEYVEFPFQVKDGYADCYKAVKDGNEIGYIFITSAKGYGGDISVMTAIDQEKTIKAIKILSADDETPGLGQNVKRADFLKQFSKLKDNITAVKNGADNTKGEINAVTGATRSSRAVTTAVNKALEYMNELTQEVTANE